MLSEKLWTFLMNTTDKILPAHSFPNIVLFKIYNRINLNFGVTIVALDLKLLSKIKWGCQLAELEENRKECKGDPGCEVALSQLKG